MTTVREDTLTQELAIRYAGDILYNALLASGKPLKISELVRLADRPEVDVRLARVVLALSPGRFVAQDRRWTLAVQNADPRLPVERVLEETLEAAGRPVQPGGIGGIVAAVYKREPEVFSETVARLLRGSDRFALVPGYGYVRRCWLLDADAEEPEDVLFTNFLEAGDVRPYEEAARLLRKGDPQSVAAFLDSVGEPVPGKVLQFLVWRTDPGRFVPEKAIAAMLDAGCVVLSGQVWIGPGVEARLKDMLPQVAELEVPEEIGAVGAEAAQPLTVSEAELQQLVDYVLQREQTSRAGAMLEDIFEVTPGDPTYEGDLQTVVEKLRGDERVLWVGSDRFVAPGVIPAYVHTVPDNLRFNEAEYLDLEGNPVDFLLEDEGLTGTLRQDIMSPLAQDVLDEEPPGEPEDTPPVTVRCVLKFHHKEIGTFPLCQLPPGYFPTEPTIVQVEVVLPSGQVAQAWVNNETRLLYGLLEWYNTVPSDTGAVFYLERQAPDRYVLTWGEENEPAMFVSRGRVEDLLELRRRAEAEELPTFEILKEILEHYRKGVEFITALTEVNIVRRTRRRMVASLLSGYHCFYQRNNVWVFDSRKLSQGFDKSRRKYLVAR